MFYQPKLPKTIYEPNASERRKCVDPARFNSFFRDRLSARTRRLDQTAFEVQPILCDSSLAKDKLLALGVAHAIARSANKLTKRLSGQELEVAINTLNCLRAWPGFAQGFEMDTNGAPKGSSLAALERFERLAMSITMNFCGPGRHWGFVAVQNIIGDPMFQDVPRFQLSHLELLARTIELIYGAFEWKNGGQHAAGQSQKPSPIANADKALAMVAFITRSQEFDLENLAHLNILIKKEGAKFVEIVVQERDRLGAIKRSRGHAQALLDSGAYLQTLAEKA
jgi:hypothetical protein